MPLNPSARRLLLSGVPGGRPGPFKETMAMLRILALAAGLMACSATGAQAVDSSLGPQANATFLAANAKKPGVVVEASGLQHRAIHTGYGKRPNATDLVTVNYKGSLIDGKVFDATEPGLPAQFPVN